MPLHGSHKRLIFLPFLVLELVTLVAPSCRCAFRRSWFSLAGTSRPGFFSVHPERWLPLFGASAGHFCPKFPNYTTVS